MEAGQAVEDLRREEPEIWAATRFIAAPDVRSDIEAIHRLDLALRQIPKRAPTPLLRDIRIAWWLEGLEAAAEGGRCDAPALRALAPLARRRADVRHHLAARITAVDLDAETGLDMTTALALCDRLYGTVLAAAMLTASEESDPHAAQAAARAWGLAHLYRQRRLAGTPGLVQAVDAALRKASAGAARLPLEAFPAVAHVTFAQDMIRNRAIGPLQRIARLTLAVATAKL